MDAVEFVALLVQTILVGAIVLASFEWHNPNGETQIAGLLGPAFFVTLMLIRLKWPPRTTILMGMPIIAIASDRPTPFSVGALHIIDWRGAVLVLTVLTTHALTSASHPTRGLEFVSLRMARAHVPGSHSLDNLALQTLRCAESLHTGRGQWSSPRQSRSWQRDLDNLAAYAELSFRLTERLDRTSSRQVRQTLTEEARRLATLIRLHQHPIATAAGPEDIDSVVASLVYGIEAMLAGDREALLEHAPPAPPQSQRVKEFLRTRVVPAAVLLVFGVLAPQAPVLRHSKAVANSITATLVLFALVSLVTANKEVAGQLNDTIGKGLAKAYEPPTKDGGGTKSTKTE
ncbi:hypothetical protein [Streptomyces sp. NPDC046759]|uniref:hypothetical protein n=1 Tax=Streptomyces sp. NPDC046759 TaxID=3155019 RepID=UPI0034104D75